MSDLFHSAQSFQSLSTGSKEAHSFPHSCSILIDENKGSLFSENFFSRLNFSILLALSVAEGTD